MPWGTRTAVVALAAALITGCGSSDDKSIPPDASGQLIAQLHTVQDQVDAGQCELAQGQAIRFQAQVADLPSSVDPATKKDLTTLADKLIELTNNPDQCVPIGATGESGVAESSTESSTTETAEATTETSTTTSTTSTTSTTPPEQEPPSTPSQGSQGNQDQGNASGTGIGTNAGGTGGVGTKPRQEGSRG